MASSELSSSRDRLPPTRLADLIAILHGGTRLEVLRALADGPLDVSSLADRLDLDRTLVSHHLASLRDAGLVVCSGDGRRHVCSLGPAATCSRTPGGVELELKAGTGSVLRISVTHAEAGRMWRTTVTPGAQQIANRT